MTADKYIHTCNQCGKEFKYESEKRRHERSHSPQFQCKKCSKNFSYISALRRHEKQHERSGTVTCNECRKDFRDEVLLKRHLKYAHAGSFTCTKCDTIFKSEPALRTHMQTHKPESEKRYQCSFEGCSKKFNFAHHLKHHELTHSNTKQHFCKICGKGFIQLHHLKTHLRTHSSDTSFNCSSPECNKKFATEYAKKRHESKYHKAENGLSPVSNIICDSPKYATLKTSTPYYGSPKSADYRLCNGADANMCPFADFKKENEDIAEGLSKSDCRENLIDSTSYSDNNNAPIWKTQANRCIMKDNKEKCLCAQITKTLDNYDVIQFEDTINFNTLSIDTNDQQKKCCGGSCHKGNDLVKDEMPEMEYKTNGTVKIKEFLDVRNENEKIIDANKNNEIKYIPFNSCKSILGNCIVSGNGMIGDGCLCAKMAIDDQATAQEIEDITPHPNDGLTFII